MVSKCGVHPILYLFLYFIIHFFSSQLLLGIEFESPARQLNVIASTQASFNDNNIHKKILHFDWLRAVQLFSKTVQKRVNSVQKEETNQAF